MGLYKRSLEIEEKALLSEEINDISSDELEKARKTKSFLEKAIRKASEFSILARLVVAYAYAEVAYIRLLIFFKGLNTFSDITNLFEEWKNIRIGIGKKKSEIMKLKSQLHKNQVLEQDEEARILAKFLESVKKKQELENEQIAKKLEDEKELNR
jgi:3-polyprenyl-4-hydroxybenzoate decarboxylase